METTLEFLTTIKPGREVHVSHFDAIQCDGRRLKGFEAFHGAGQLLDKPAVFFNCVVEVFDLQNFDQPEPSMQ